MQFKTYSLLAVIVLSSVATRPAVAVCIPHLSRTTLSSNFVDNRDGTVIDASTGLIWKRCSEGQTWTEEGCTGPATGFSWGAALKRVEEINRGGGHAQQTDWRLPNIKELTSIVERACAAPSINEQVFPATPSDGYWSSTPDADSGIQAWITSFDDGSDGPANKGNLYPIRLIRAGSEPLAD